MNEPMSLRGYALDILNNLDNPNYVPPAVTPYVPPTPKLPAFYVMPARKVHKVYTVPPVGAPSKMSPEARRELDEFLASVDEVDESEPLLETAHEARKHAEKHFTRIDEVHKIAQRDVEKAGVMRDTFRFKEVIPDADEAKAKLRSLAIQEKFAVPDTLARNMQALCSYYNNKEQGKRFKTERAGGTTSMLIIWRTR